MTTTEPPRPTTLTRPTSGRVIAGVAAGLATRTELPVWLIRIALLVLIPVGGSGLLLYLAGWVLIPEEGDTRPPAGRFVADLHGTRGIVGAGLFALAVVIVADNTGIVDGDLAFAAVLFVAGVLLYRGDLTRDRTEGHDDDANDTNDNQEEPMTPTALDSGGIDSGGTPVGPRSGAGAPPPPPPPAATPPPPPPRPPRPAPPPSHLGRLTVAAVFIVLGVMALFDTVGTVDILTRQYLATGLVVIGAGLLVGAFLGRARWLIVVGIFALPAVVAAPIADIGFDGRFETERLRYAPATVEEIEGSYTADVADMVIDLSAVDFGGETVELEASIDIGELVVIVPDDVAVEATGQLDIGEVEVLGRASGGLGDVRVTDTSPGDNGSLIVSASADLGRVEVSRVGAARSPSGDSGDLDATVVSPSELQGSYSVGVGDVTLDFSDLRLETRRDVEISTDAGDVTVLLPETGNVQVLAEVDAGSLAMPDRTYEGIDRTAEYRRGEQLLVLDIEVGVGSISIEE